MQDGGREKNKNTSPSLTVEKTEIPECFTPSYDTNNEAQRKNTPTHKKKKKQADQMNTTTPKKDKKKKAQSKK